MKRHFNKNKKGITLVALVITIIVMLILLGVTVSVQINGGLFNYAGKAVSDTKISSEKISLTQAVALTIAENKNGKIIKDELQQKLNNIVGKDKTTVYDAGEDFEVLFKESGLYYELDKNGNVGDYKTPVKDKIPGNIGVDENGNILTGDSDAPYQINCIEDLVVLANLANGVGNYINEKGEITEISEINKFAGKYIELMRTLNFESPTSYADLSIKWSYDSEQDAYIIDETSTTNLMEIITDKNGVGFVPIGSDEGGTYFKACSFDGRFHEIQNIYENREGDPCCLFNGWGWQWPYGKPTLKNLGITGTYEPYGYGLTNSGSDLRIFNCYSLVDGANLVRQCEIIINCFDGGNGNSTGLLGEVRDGHTTQIINCCNLRC